ncbi:MAG: hypothetical protein C5B50_03880 [Verrucomicrobia bacterium]|nr:MAG: hypothetical protein C5B50_03880 [Verrucomicrobiota bacterium]
MKTLLVVLLGFAGFVANAQSTNAVSRGAERTLQAQKSASDRAIAQLFQERKPNEAMVGKRLVSGIAVQAAKTRNPLQLINPFAPARYGSGTDNLALNPINGRPEGLKVVGIQF